MVEGLAVQLATLAICGLVTSRGHERARRRRCVFSLPGDDICPGNDGLALYATNNWLRNTQAMSGGFDKRWAVRNWRGVDALRASKAWSFEVMSVLYQKQV